MSDAILIPVVFIGASLWLALWLAEVTINMFHAHVERGLRRSGRILESEATITIPPHLRP